MSAKFGQIVRKRYSIAFVLAASLFFIGTQPASAAMVQFFNGAGSPNIWYWGGTHWNKGAEITMPTDNWPTLKILVSFPSGAVTVSGHLVVSTYFARTFVPVACGFTDSDNTRYITCSRDSA